MFLFIFSFALFLQQNTKTSIERVAAKCQMTFHENTEVPLIQEIGACRRCYIDVATGHIKLVTPEQKCLRHL